MCPVEWGNSKLLAALLDHSPPTQRILAGNEATPAAALIHLATYPPDAQIRGALIANPSFPAAEMSAAWWNETLRLVDPQAALAASSRVDLPAGVEGVEHFALSNIRETLHALENGAEKVVARQWSELPSRLNEPFSLSTSVVSAIEAQRLCGLSAEVARNGKVLDELHDTMGNCLDRYIERARSGNTIVASYVDKSRREIYAIAWNRRADGTLSLGEMNSRFNAGQLPPGFAEAEASLRESINEAVRSADGPTVQQRPFELNN